MVKRDWANPILVKELRSRMRGAKAYWIEGLYVLALALTLLVAYWAWQESGSPSSWTLGRDLFYWLSGVQAVLVMLLAPAFAAGAITLEREQQSLEMLLLTRLQARSVIWGKLASAMLFVVLLLTTSLPLVCVCFLLGGVSPREVATVYFALVQCALIFGAMGLAWSAIARKTTVATAWTYISVAAYFAGTLLLGVQAVDEGIFGSGAVNIFGGLNPCTLSLVAGERVEWFGWTMPLTYPTLLLNALIALVLILCATARFSEEREPYQGIGLRLASLGLFLALAAASGGNWCNMFGPWPAIQTLRPSVQEVSPAVLYLLVGVLAVLALAAPLFAAGPEAGELRGSGGRGWSPLSWLRPSPRTALIFLLAALALTLPVVGAMFLAGNYMVQQIQVSQFQVAPAATGAFAPHSWAVEALRSSLPALGQMYLVILACLVFYVLLSRFVFTLVPRRWPAVGLSLGLMALSLLLPIASAFTLPNQDWTALDDQLAYLWPYWALWYASDPGEFHREMPDFWVGSLPFWAVTVLSYATLSAGLVGLTRLVRRK